MVPSQISQQSVKTINISLLKGLKDVSVDFKTPGLTAIMGPNGVGKSTILHALACCYKPVENETGENYKFSRFFTPTTDSPWKGSSFSIIHDFREGSNQYSDVETIFSKAADRWSPKYERRTARSVIYIGIDTCVPRIEKEKKDSFIRFSASDELTDAISLSVKQKAGFVMNRDYSHYRINNSKKADYKGVEFANTRYSELSMGAGEQRVFSILEKVLEAEKHSLILIDEIDLLLHPDALKRMVRVLNERAVEKKLQIVFTSHSPTILEMQKEVDVRHICPTKEKTLCFTNTNPDAIQRLTGEPCKPLTIFVEDKFAKTIVQEICHRTEIAPYVAVLSFGAAINAFTVGAGLVLQGKSVDNTLFVLDGDEYASPVAQGERIGKVLTGDSDDAKQQRLQVARQIVSFELTPGANPEMEIITMIRNGNDLPDNHITKAIAMIQCGYDNHDILDRVLNNSGYDEQYEVGCNRIVSIAAATSEWDRLVGPIQSWLLRKKDEMLK